MKCSKCKTNERTGTSAYCRECHAEYMKNLRASKLEKLQEPVSPELHQTDEETACSDDVKKDAVYTPSPIYWSYYVTKGSDTWKMFKDIEAKMTSHLDHQT